MLARRFLLALPVLAMLCGVARAAAPAKLGEVVGVRQAEFSADASRVILRTEGGAVSRWNAATGARLPGEWNIPAESFVMSGDGRCVLVAMKDGRARIFAADSGAALSPLLEVHCRVPAWPEAVFAPSTGRVLIFEAGSAFVFEIKSGRRLAKLPLDPVTAVDEDIEVAPSAAFTKDGAHCFIMTPSGVVTRFDAATWKPVGPAMPHPAAEMAYRFGFAASDDGRWVATFDDPGENGPKSHLQVWDAATGEAIGAPIVAVNGLTGAFFPASSSRLLVTPGRGEAVVYDLPSFKKSCVIAPHDEVEGPKVTASPDGKWLLSWGSDRIVRLQSAATGTVQESQSFEARISQVLMLPDSSGCLVVFDNTAFLLRDYHDHYVLKLRFPDLQTTHSLRLTEWLSRVVLSPDGRRLLLQAGQREKEHVLLFDTATLQPPPRRK